MRYKVLEPLILHRKYYRIGDVIEAPESDRQTWTDLTGRGLAEPVEAEVPPAIAPGEEIVTRPLQPLPYTSGRLRLSGRGLAEPVEAEAPPSTRPRRKRKGHNG